MQVCSLTSELPQVAWGLGFPGRFPSPYQQSSSLLRLYLSFLFQFMVDMFKICLF